MAESTPPVLDITTQTRQTVKIDGAPYQLRGQSDLTLMDYNAIIRDGPRLGALLTSAGEGTLKTKDGAELDELLDVTCTLALIASPAVIKKLGQVEKAMVCTAFLGPLGPTIQRLIPQGLVQRLPPGTKSSHGSNGSTAGTLLGGSRRSRTASSKRT